MQKVDFLLEKRSAKLMLYLAVALFLVPMSIGLIVGMLSHFMWLHLVLLGLFGFGDYLIFGALQQYFLYKDVRLVVESDGKTIKFWNTNAAGKVFNASEAFELDKMARFYIVKKRTRYLMTNFSYEFEEKSGLSILSKEEVSVFPALYEASENDRKAVLEFVKSVAPNIALGYESFWNKISKKD
jgi:hypothetical protein